MSDICILYVWRQSANEQDLHYVKNFTNSLCNFTEFFAHGLILQVQEYNRWPPL